ARVARALVRSGQPDRRRAGRRRLAVVGHPDHGAARNCRRPPRRVDGAPGGDPGRPALGSARDHDRAQRVPLVRAARPGRGDRAGLRGVARGPPRLRDRGADGARGGDVVRAVRRRGAARDNRLDRAFAGGVGPRARARSAAHVVAGDRAARAPGTRGRRGTRVRVRARRSRDGAGSPAAGPDHARHPVLGRQRHRRIRRRRAVRRSAGRPGPACHLCTDEPLRPGPRVRGRLAMAELRCEQITASYGQGGDVLSGVDLVVPDGTLTAILGASGSGKTTLLRVIMGFIAQERGTVTVGDAVVAQAGGTHLPPEKRSIGYVAQEGALYPHLSVAENVSFGLPRRERKEAIRAAEVLELVGLGARYGKRRPHELSGGEQRRVALARALAPRPPLVLLDEPFSGLDAALRAETRAAVLHALAAQGTTAVLVTHDQAEALSMG